MQFGKHFITLCHKFNPISPFPAGASAFCAKAAVTGQEINQSARRRFFTRATNEFAEK